MEIDGGYYEELLGQKGVDKLFVLNEITKERDDMDSSGSWRVEKKRYMSSHWVLDY